MQIDANMVSSGSDLVTNSGEFIDYCSKLPYFTSVGEDAGTFGQRRTIVKFRRRKRAELIFSLFNDQCRRAGECEYEYAYMYEYRRFNGVNAYVKSPYEIMTNKIMVCKLNMASSIRDIYDTFCGLEPTTAKSKKSNKPKCIVKPYKFSDIPDQSSYSYWCVPNHVIAYAQVVAVSLCDGVFSDIIGDNIWYLIRGFALGHGNVMPKRRKAGYNPTTFAFSMLFDGVGEFYPAFVYGKNRGRIASKFTGSVKPEMFTIIDRDMLSSMVQRYLVSLV